MARSSVGLSLSYVCVCASLAPEIGLAATAYGSQCLSRREPVAPLAHGGQRSTDGGIDLDRAGKRVPSATKISPSAIGVITANGESSP